MASPLQYEHGLVPAVYSHLSRIQDTLAGLGAGFGSALADNFLSESLRILAEHLSDVGLTPATDTSLLYAPPIEAGVFLHLINPVFSHPKDLRHFQILPLWKIL